MVRLQAAALLVLAFAMALAAWAPATSAGTADAPEVTDAGGDQTLATLPAGPAFGAAGQFTNADLLAGFVTETADAFVFSVQVAGAGTSTTTTNYQYDFHFTVGTTAYEAIAVLENSAAGSGTAVPGGVTSEVAAGGGIIAMTVPRAAVGNPLAGTSITALSIDLTGTIVTDPLALLQDRAPDSGAGSDYAVTGGAGGGPSAGGNATASDKDGDGLNDTWEVNHFGNVTKQNGTGDPDADGLNNTAEQKLGTDPTKPDTDSDGLNDKDDPYPLDAHRPGTKDAGNTTDSDHDGLPDSWEREHFGNMTQAGSGDPDKDGLNNTAENKAKTDPLKADTDGDGHLDGTDFAPLDAAVSEKPSTTHAKPELYSGAAMFAVAATFCLFGLAKPF